MHLMIWAAIGPALLQRVADIWDLCSTISDVLDCMFSATLLRQYHVKELLEKELQFYPTLLIHLYWKEVFEEVEPC